MGDSTIWAILALVVGVAWAAIGWWARRRSNQSWPAWLLIGCGWVILALAELAWTSELHPLAIALGAIGAGVAISGAMYMIRQT